MRVDLHVDPLVKSLRMNPSLGTFCQLTLRNMVWNLSPTLDGAWVGEQLYTFGGIPVQADQLVHVEIPRGSGNWTSISVEVLMQKIKQLEK